MLGLLDLRERGERLEPSRFEVDPTATEAVQAILERVRVEGDPVTVRSVVQMTAEAAERLAPQTSAIARSEGSVGHAKAMDARADGRSR